MTTWVITNATKKNAVEIQEWMKDGVVFKRLEGFRWGTWFCESDEQPDIDLDNPDGFNVGWDDYEWEMEEMMDGSWADWEFPDEMSQEEREAVEAAWDEDTYDGLEQLGWNNVETEQWIYGPIKLTNQDTGEEFVGSE